MRILQLIDSLLPGGAERMAVLYANALAKRIDRSYLCSTRLEGILLDTLSSDVDYLFLQKKSTLDFSAFLKLRRYIIKNRIQIIQAHSSSWFLALMVKLSFPEIHVVWHDHYGRELSNRKVAGLKLASKYFDGIICVNKDLQNWAIRELKFPRSYFIKNFLPFSETGSKKAATIHTRIKTRTGKEFRIVCLANLRPQKDHLNLLEAFLRVNTLYPFISLFLIGRNENNAYQDLIREFIEIHQLDSKVFLLGEQKNVISFLEDADLGIISSKSEGLPVALLEYGRSGLPVISTRVGDCEELVGSNGILVPPRSPIELAKAIIFYIQNENKRMVDAKNFRNKVASEFSEDSVLPEILAIFKELVVRS